MIDLRGAQGVLVGDGGTMSTTFVLPPEPSPPELVVVGAIPGRPPANVERAELAALREEVPNGFRTVALLEFV